MVFQNIVTWVTIRYAIKRIVDVLAMTNIDQLDTRLRLVENKLTVIQTELHIAAWVIGVTVSLFMTTVTYLILR